MLRRRLIFSFFFFNDTATTEIYTLSLHDALPISVADSLRKHVSQALLLLRCKRDCIVAQIDRFQRSEEHTSELQSRLHLVCRLLLEKKKTTNEKNHNSRNEPHPHRRHHQVQHRQS